jgi:hypothetical protein
MIELNPPEIPGSELVLKTIKDFNKKAAGAVMGKFKRIMATASDPFFRRDLGERYFISDAGSGATMMWIGATVLSCCAGTRISAVLKVLNLESMADTIDSLRLPAIVGTLFVLMYVSFWVENVARLVQFRRERKLYHSMSRGTPRWKGKRLLLTLILVALALLVPLLFCLLIISWFMSTRIAAEQEAAIYSRYLDALDQKVESEFMESALLGECPPEITYLCKPLSKNLDPQLRNDIAAAAVGKPVGIVATGPKSRKAATPEQPKPETETTPTSPDPSARQPNFESEATPANRGIMALLRSRRFVIFMAVAVIVAGLNNLWMPALRSIQAKLDHRQALSSQPQSQDRTVITPASVQSTSQEQQRDRNPAPATPVVALAPSQPDHTAQAQAASELRERQEREAQEASALQKHQEREKAIEQAATTLSAQITQLAAFQSNCKTRLDNNTNKISGLSYSSRKKLKEENGKDWDVIQSVVKAQYESLSQLLVSLKSNSSRAEFDIGAFNEQLDIDIEKLSSVRHESIAMLDQLDAEIANAPAKSGFLFFR